MILLSLFNYPVYTVLVGSGKYDCYHHVTNESFHFDYSVEGGGNLDIIFEAFNHKEEKIVEFPKNATGYHLFKEIGQNSSPPSADKISLFLYFTSNFYNN